jgi:tetratricopeptide (TPR) repeat protein
MSASGKDVMAELARAKGHFHRHDVPRTLISTATALKTLLGSQIVGRDKAQVSATLMEMVQNLNRSDEILRYHPEGVEYAKGGEKRLLVTLVDVLKRLREDAARESLEETRERKLKMDRLLIRGQKLLDGGKVGEAEECFQEAVELYVDEHKLFYFIARKLVDADQPRPALKYLKRALQLLPDDEQAHLALARAYFQMGAPDKAEAGARRVLKEFGPMSDAWMLLAQTFRQRGQHREAYAAAKKALALDPNMVQARKLMKAVKKQVQG